MARQIDIDQISGTLGNRTYYKSRFGYLIKVKSAVTKKRIETDPDFQRTRENMQEFTTASKATALLRSAIRTLILQARDITITGRINSVMHKALRADTVNVRGARNIADGDISMLQGFNCNSNAPLEATVYMPFTVTLDRPTGKGTITIPSYMPKDTIIAPEGANRYRIVALGAELDFRTGTYVSDSQSSPVLPLDSQPTANLVLTTSVTPASTHPLVLLLGIQFFQHVNGTDYALKDGTFNALSIIRVSHS